MAITKHGRPVARVLPYPPPPETLIGALRDKIVVRDDILSTGIAWQLAWCTCGRSTSRWRESCAGF